MHIFLACMHMFTQQRTQTHMHACAHTLTHSRTPWILPWIDFKGNRVHLSF